MHLMGHTLMSWGHNQDKIPREDHQQQSGGWAVEQHDWRAQSFAWNPLHHIPFFRNLQTWMKYTWCNSYVPASCRLKLSSFLTDASNLNFKEFPLVLVVYPRPLWTVPQGKVLLTFCVIPEPVPKHTLMCCIRGVTSLSKMKGVAAVQCVLGCWGRVLTLLPFAFW